MALRKGIKVGRLIASIMDTKSSGDLIGQKLVR